MKINKKKMKSLTSNAKQMQLAQTPHVAGGTFVVPLPLVTEEIVNCKPNNSMEGNCTVTTLLSQVCN